MVALILFLVFVFPILVLFASWVALLITTFTNDLIYLNLLNGKC